MNSTSLNVLLVVDNQGDADLVIAELKQSRYRPKALRVDTVSALKSALLEQRWDVILCGDGVPQFNGHDVLRIVRDELAVDTPVIFISGGIGEETAIELMRAGAQDYVAEEQSRPVAAGDQPRTRRGTDAPCQEAG